jgi:hypothetical protein
LVLRYKKRTYEDQKRRNKDQDRLQRDQLREVFFFFWIGREFSRGYLRQSHIGKNGKNPDKGHGKSKFTVFGGSQYPRNVYYQDQLQQPADELGKTQPKKIIKNFLPGPAPAKKTFEFFYSPGEWDVHADQDSKYFMV